MQSSRSSTGSGGFTLIEVVVGLALMATVLVASLLSFSAHRQQLRLADGRIAAAAVADEMLETLNSQPDGIPANGRGRVAGKANWFWQTKVVGVTAPLEVPMQVIRFSIIELSGDGRATSLVSVDLLEVLEA